MLCCAALPPLCICSYIYIYIYIYIYMYVCIYIYIYIYICTHTDMPTLSYICKKTMYACIYTPERQTPSQGPSLQLLLVTLPWLSICICTSYIYIYIYIYTRKHEHKNVCKYTFYTTYTPAPQTPSQGPSSQSS